MSEMIERVARAIASNPPSERTEYRDSGPVIVRDFERTARAAIEAMRDIDEGSPAILAAGKKALYSCSSDPELEDARGAWHAMIDAALKETV